MSAKKITRNRLADAELVRIGKYLEVQMRTGAFKHLTKDQILKKVQGTFSDLTINAKNLDHIAESWGIKLPGNVVFANGSGKRRRGTQKFLALKDGRALAQAVAHLMRNSNLEVPKVVDRMVMGIFSSAE